MVKSTIDDIKDITLERQIRKLADVIDEQNNKIDVFADYSTDINNLKESDANQTIQINNLKQTVATDKLATDSAIIALQNKDTEQDGTLTEHTTLIQSITESLVSGVQIMSGTTTGEIKVRLERESVATIDSNNYNLGLPVSAEVIQGTGPSMFKIQITMSSGVKVVSNDFVFTTEAIGTDVYISSFTFKAGNQTGYLSADIGLNNGVVIEANNFLVPTDPNVTSAITDLQNRVSTIESTGVAGLNELKTTVEGHTTSINELNTDVTNLTTNKADVNNSNQSITAGTINATNINKNGVEVATTNDIPDISGKVNIAQGIENAGKVLGIGSDGNVTPVTAGGSSGGGDNWVLTDKPILELAKLTYGSQYYTFEIFQDFKVVLIGNENNYTFYFEHTFTKGKINLGNNTSFSLIKEFCNGTSTSNALSFRDGTLGQFVVNNKTATQSADETEIIPTNTSKYRLYIKSST